MQDQAGRTSLIFGGAEFEHVLRRALFLLHLTGKEELYAQAFLIVTNSEKSIAFFTELLHQNAYESITFIENCGKARRMLLEREFDLCIINAPLADESGIEFAIHVASDGICQVILIVKSELFDEASAGVEEFGVFTVSKPINRSVFWSVLKWPQLPTTVLRG